jgi:pimeloyl-ACP methyl ester carboxylesterase
VAASWRSWLECFSCGSYGQRQALILINGLAEQAQSWFRNRWYWQRHFDVHMPNLLIYDGVHLHRRIADGLPIDVDYLVGRLEQYLDSFVQIPPYALVAASLGAKIAVEYVRRHPEEVESLTLLGPAGLSEQERLPRVAGVQRSRAHELIGSIFHNPERIDPRLITYYQRQLQNPRWRLGVVKTIRGTMHHRIRDHLPHLHCPLLIITGREDRIVAEEQVAAAARLCPQVHYVCMPACGHAPQMEKPWPVNRAVVEHVMAARSTTGQPTPAAA